jgi:hypothetical protein
MQSGFANLRHLLPALAAALFLAASSTGGAASDNCTREDFGMAVNDAGVALRALNAENAPRLQAKMRDLKTKMRWPDAGYEEKAFQVLQDERVASLDANANDQLARIDALGTVDPNSAPDCAKLHEIRAVSIELQATVKAKSAYLLNKIDMMMGGTPIAVPKNPPPPAKTTAAVPRVPDSKPAVAPPAAKTDPVASPTTDPSPKVAAKQPGSSAWSATTVDAKPREGSIPPPSGPPPADEDGYTIDEIKAISAGFFGQISTGLGSVIEHLFRKSGRPTGYVVGSEGGGAFLAGVRYGKGTLYLRNGGTQPIYWHGPSLGTDVGAEGSKTLFLIYRLKSPEELYARFTGIDGSAYLVGGVGATFITNGNVIMAPIRSGVGLRLGASLGYIRFTSRSTWNPF